MSSLELEHCSTFCALSIINAGHFKSADADSVFLISSIINGYVHSCIKILKGYTVHSKRHLPSAFDFKLMVVLKSINLDQLAAYLEEGSYRSFLRLPPIILEQRTVSIPKSLPPLPPAYTFKRSSTRGSRDTNKVRRMEIKAIQQMQVEKNLFSLLSNMGKIRPDFVNFEL